MNFTRPIAWGLLVATCSLSACAVIGVALPPNDGDDVTGYGIVAGSTTQKIVGLTLKSASASSAPFVDEIQAPLGQKVVLHSPGPVDVRLHADTTVTLLARGKKHSKDYRVDVVVRTISLQPLLANDQGTIGTAHEQVLAQAVTLDDGQTVTLKNGMTLSLNDQ